MKRERICQGWKNNMCRFVFILLCVAAIGGYANTNKAPLAKRHLQGQKRWNIITIVTDDQGVWTVGAYGNKEALTPNMDRLAREGVRFTNAFACSGVCAPSRVALLTGLYPIQTGYNDIPYYRDPNDGLPLGVPTWTRELQKKGYVTGLIGKWHLGGNRNYYPTKYGIDYFFGFLRGTNRPLDPVLTRDGVTKNYKGYLPDILVDDAIEFLKKHRSEPFALMLHFRAPHAPHLPVTEADLAPFKDLDPAVPIVDPADAILDDDQEPASQVAIDLHEKLLKEKMISYYASVHSVDRNLGRLLDKLDKLKLADNTIILFTSDQGYMFGHRGLKGKGAAQSIRNHTLAENNFFINLYDLSLQVPLIVRWPGVVNPGTVNEELISNIDTFPTVLGMLGIPFPENTPCEGRDFSPLLRREKIAWRDALFAEYTPDQLSTMDFIRMVRTKKWKLIRTYLNAGGNKLFDLKNDRDEMHNLYYLGRHVLKPDEEGLPRPTVHPHAEVLNELQRRLTEWQVSINDPALRLEKIYEEFKKKAKQHWEK